MAIMVAKTVMANAIITIVGGPSLESLGRIVISKVSLHLTLLAGYRTSETSYFIL